MKMYRTIAFVVVALLGALLHDVAHADLVVADYNDLTPGVQQGQFGGTGLSAADDWSGTGTIDVISGDLTAPASTGYALTQSGTPLSIMGDFSNGRQNPRDLASPMTGNTVWFSYLVQNQSDASRGGIGFNGSGYTPTEPRIQTAGTSLYFDGNTVANQFTAGETALVLGRITVDDAVNADDTWDIWVDPDVSGGIGGLPAPTLSVDEDYVDAAGITRLRNISYYFGSGGNQGAIVDMVRLSDNAGAQGFADVTGVLPGTQIVPEPTSIAIWTLLGLCLAGYGYRRRKR